MQSDLAALYMKLKMGQATSSDATRGALSIQLYFSNMDETGFNSYLNAKVSNSMTSIETGDSDRGFQARMRGAMEASGISSDASVIESGTPQDRDRIAFLSKFRGIGLKGIEEEIVTQFSSLAKALPVISPSQRSQAQLRLSSARLLHVNCGATATLLGILADFTPPPFDIPLYIGVGIYTVLSLAGYC